MVTLQNRQLYSEPAYIYWSLGIKQPCSGLILPVPTRLLAIHYISECHWRMAYVVCLIRVVPILLSTSVLGLHFCLLKVRQNSKAAAGIQSLNGHGRCSHASHSLQVILIPQTNESDVSCAISCLQLSKIKLFCFLLRVAMLARDSIVYYIVIFGPCVLASKDYWF